MPYLIIKDAYRFLEFASLTNPWLTPVNRNGESLLVIRRSKSMDIGIPGCSPGATHII